MNSPISPSFTFENFQNKSLYCGSNLNEGIVKETGDFFSVYHVGLGLPMSEQIIIAYKRQKVISVSGSTLEELNHGLITDISLLHPVTHKKTSWKVLFINSLYGQIY